MKKFKKILIFIFVFLILIGAIIGFIGYKMAFSPNVSISEEYTYLYITSDSDFQNVLDSLTNSEIIKNKKFFVIISKLKKYDIYVKPGKYKINNGLSNWNLVNLLRSGNQEPVKVLIPSVRTVEALCEKVAPYFEFSEQQLVDYLNSDEFLNLYSLDNYSVPSIFIPNTYEFYWNTSVEDFVKKMKNEYDKFWTDERLAKAKKINLTQLEVIVLASIVQSEQMANPDERPIIAGLYINRLRKDIPLQSDPTLIFAIGDFTIKRVYDYQKKVQSPYNTYLNLGLPPGPILIPDINSIDAVLNYNKNDYIYMCAKEDFSGYHYFTDNLTQHLIYAKRYHNALNALNIK